MNARKSLPSEAHTKAEDSNPLARFWTTDRERYVIVAPDAMKTNPVDVQWIRDNNPFECDITLLGKRMATELMDTDAAVYRDLLLKMITAGVKVIHRHSLTGLNAKYIELHPDAEGIPILRLKSQG